MTRVGDDSGIVRPIHQEDFRQALGIPPEAKYASKGGPTFKDCFERLLRAGMGTAGDGHHEALDAKNFNLIIGNSDARGKNFENCMDQGPRMAPLYDLDGPVVGHIHGKGSILSTNC